MSYQSLIAATPSGPVQARSAKLTVSATSAVQPVEPSNINLTDTGSIK